MIIEQFDTRFDVYPSIVVRNEGKENNQSHTFRWHFIEIIGCSIGSTACPALTSSPKFLREQAIRVSKVVVNMNVAEGKSFLL